MKTNIKLTSKQNIVINCMQNGWSLITDHESSSVICANKDYEFEFSGTIFWNLVKKKLIYQEYRRPFNYVLTNEGKKIKTKSVNLFNK